MTEVYIGLGSNLNNPTAQLRQAIEALQHIPRTTLTRVSSLYSSTPMGPQDQPDYMNAAVQLQTSLSAELLLGHLQIIEAQQGRVRDAQHWGPRTLDLDILLFGARKINNPWLTVPHYGLKEREFVLIPLHEIAPDLLLLSGESIKETLSRCTDATHCSLSRDI